MQDNNNSELNLLLNYANISTKDDGVLKDLVTAMKNKILEQHPYAIYYSEHEDRWRTYLPDFTKPDKRRAVKRKNKENLEKTIIDYYLRNLKSVSPDNISLE